MSARSPTAFGDAATSATSVNRSTDSRRTSNTTSLWFPPDSRVAIGSPMAPSPRKPIVSVAKSIRRAGGPSDERAAVAQRLRGANDVGVVLGPVVVTCRAVLTADDGDHEGAVGQGLETVNIARRDNHGDLARRELDVLDHPQFGM